MAAQIFNLEALQPLSDCCACFVKGKETETGRDFEYAPFHYLPGWSLRVGQDSGSGEGELNTQRLNQRHEDVPSLTGCFNLTFERLCSRTRRRSWCR
jgi:hypothetical protein